jgi:hypothetical protein
MKRMNAGVFPACAVTLATKRPLAEEEILLQSGTITGSIITLPPAKSIPNKKEIN